ncbi:hypothetical protein BO70DRAFT_139190 [Aspergillus heteromorphus CBS 117.55]|uniref:Uncharacterized protein n=1 Tax=Aspergillus heteromorphus CBS 117.55 TaxID=1448321 RepID=A0A317VAT4_9EURO|nr:uncharacterized protein BO70DRAFT_139190 [Aspergillus heteromorphus CBS 117.55]PWY70489.1 hypothetical protein BO70DRAFT_139190 [Aspergillus heteromorphus CBS 117.55]
MVQTLYYILYKRQLQVFSQVAASSVVLLAYAFLLGLCGLSPTIYPHSKSPSRARQGLSRSSSRAAQGRKFRSIEEGSGWVIAFAGANYSIIQR